MTRQPDVFEWGDAGEEQVEHKAEDHDDGCRLSKFAQGDRHDSLIVGDNALNIEGLFDHGSQNIQ